MAIKKEKLTKQEEAAMLAIWKTGKGFVRDFLDQHAAPLPHYNTLVSTIKNLEKKGFVDHKLVGNINEYFPVIKEADYKKQFLTNVVKDHFSDSYKELVTFFAEEKKISTKDLKEIIEMIEKKK
jgi:predicted transcriptional regulator